MKLRLMKCNWSIFLKNQRWRKKKSKLKKMWKLNSKKKLKKLRKNTPMKKCLPQSVEFLMRKISNNQRLKKFIWSLSSWSLCPSQNSNGQILKNLQRIWNENQSIFNLSFQLNLDLRRFSTKKLWELIKKDWVQRNCSQF